MFKNETLPILSVNLLPFYITSYNFPSNIFYVLILENILIYYSNLIHLYQFAVPGQAYVALPPPPAPAPAPTDNTLPGCYYDLRHYSIMFLVGIHCGVL